MIIFCMSLFIHSVCALPFPRLETLIPNNPIMVHAHMFPYAATCTPSVRLSFNAVPRCLAIPLTFLQPLHNKDDSTYIFLALEVFKSVPSSNDGCRKKRGLVGPLSLRSTEVVFLLAIQGLESIYLYHRCHDKAGSIETFEVIVILALSKRIYPNAKCKDTC